MGDIDFDLLSLKDALDLAILIEEEAEERYLEFVDQMEKHHSPDTARFFRFMARNEAKHGEELGRRREELFGDATRDVDPSVLYEVEAPEYLQVRAFMSPREALQVALASEEKAYDFFDRALPALADEEVRNLFTELREEEVEHRRLVREELAKLPPEPGFDPADFVDPPQAQ